VQESAHSFRLKNIKSFVSIEVD